eukprot:gene9437-12717_t
MWKRAFQHAIEVEKDEEKLLIIRNDDIGKSAEKSVPITYTSRKKIKLIQTDQNDNTDNRKLSSVKDNEEVESGGFCQPKRLAAFMSKILNNSEVANSIDETSLDSINKPTTDDVFRCYSSITIEFIAPLNEIDVTTVSSDLSKQLCRSWLKKEYLQIGQGCNNLSCGRKHIITEKNPERLYKDYSFKGLSSKQRSQILDKLRSNSNNETNTVNDSLNGTTTEETEKIS